MAKISDNNETKNCKSCQSEINAKAKKCPHCQEDLRSWFRRHPILTFLGIIILMPSLTTVLTGSSTSVNNQSSTNNSKSTPTPTIIKRNDFIAEVIFTGTQFEISNLDTNDCVDSRISLNDEYNLDGYTITAGETYKIGAGQFTKSDGTRFNPFSTKPLNIYIYCNGNNELYGADYFAEWQ